jgi:hypothetical protein
MDTEKSESDDKEPRGKSRFLTIIMLTDFTEEHRLFSIFVTTQLGNHFPPFRRGEKRIKMNSSPIPPIIWRAGMVVKAPLFSKRM